MVHTDSHTPFVLADIPGLIEGAHQGTGLGIQFLRHIERTRILIHLLDGGSSDPLEDWAMISQELALYDARLEDKPQIVVLNKIDLPDAVFWEPLVKEAVQEAGFPFEVISAYTGKNVRNMIFQVSKLLNEAPEPLTDEANMVLVGPPDDSESFRISRFADGWRVEGYNIERVAAMTYWEFEATTRRFQQILDKMGISTALKKAGIVSGETVYIGEEILEWSD